MLNGPSPICFDLYHYVVSLKYANIMLNRPSPICFDLYHNVVSLKYAYIMLNGPSPICFDLYHNVVSLKYANISRTSGPISTILGMQHGGLLPIIVCSNDDPGLP